MAGKDRLTLGGKKDPSQRNFVLFSKGSNLMKESAEQPEGPKRNGVPYPV